MGEKSFLEIMEQIDNNKYLLPDFQREFVWTDEEQQISIVASVLAKMPIGSVLLLKAKPDEYICKNIGSIETIDQSSLDEEISLIIDGQQRITVLTNVFSNIVHSKTTKVSKLADASLKRRFFVKIPRYKVLIGDLNAVENDIFGEVQMKFPTDENIFLTEIIKRYIEVSSFTAKDKKPFNPKYDINEIEPDLVNYCTADSDYYRIPLFLISSLGYEDKSVAEICKKHILKNIKNNISNEIEIHFEYLNDDEKIEYCKIMFGNDFEYSEDNKPCILRKFEDLADMWIDKFSEYISDCLKSIKMYSVIIGKENRERAIDIYENMNRGGISLSTFDLITAKVAIENSENLMKRIRKYIEDKDRKYDYSLIRDASVSNQLKKTIEFKIQDGDIAKTIDKYINASVFANCYKGSEKRVIQTYLDCFLNIMSLFCNNKEYQADNYKTELIRKDRILALTPKELDNNAEMVAQSIDRALFFFETRCGIRDIKNINYNLMICIVGTIFTNDIWWNDVNVHNLLEAWYWSCVFSGDFDKYQNDGMIRNLKQLVKTIRKDIQKDWIENLKRDILDRKDFSDLDLLLMKKVESDGKAPKAFIKEYLCQYMLSRTYHDMFDSRKLISVFLYRQTENINDTLEAHHIIPLKTAATYGESTEQLRNKKDDILNSPLNYVYITKSSNISISGESPISYFDRVTAEAKTDLLLTEFSKDTDVEKFLKQRYYNLLGAMKGEVQELLDEANF